MKSLLYAYWRHSALVLFIFLAGKCISLAWKIYLARLGPENLGAVTVYLTLYTTLSSFALLGLQTALMRFVSIAAARHAQMSARYILSMSLRITGVVSLLITGIVYLFPTVIPSLITSSLTDIRTAQTYLWVVPLLAVSELCWGYLAAIGKNTQYALFKYLIPPAGRFVLLIILTAMGLSTHFVLVSHIAIATGIIFILSIPYFLKFINPIPKEDKILRINFLNFAAPMSVSFILYILYGALDILFIGRFFGTITVGFLTALLLFADIPDLVLGPVLNIFQAHMSKTYQDIRKGLLFTLVNILIFLAAGMVIGGVVYLFRWPLVVLLVGDAYTNIIRFIAVFIIIKTIDTTITLPLRHFLEFYGHVKITLFLMGTATAIKFAVGLLLIPSMELVGVAISGGAAVAVHMCGCLIATWYVYAKHR